MAWAEFSGYPGKVRYHYHTPDGGPPNMGCVPLPPDVEQSFGHSFGGMGSMPGLGGLGGFGGISSFGGGSYYPSCPNFGPSNGMPGMGMPQPPPGWYKVEKPVAPDDGAADTEFTGRPSSCTDIPAPPPPQYRARGQANGRATPFTGNRVKEQLAKFPDNKMGYIFPKNNAVIHIFHENIVNKYGCNNGIVTVPIASRHDFSVQAVSCDMTFEELIEQIDCKKRAIAHPPYSFEGYPDEGIGIQELLEQGDGKFILGSKIMLSDYRIKERIGSIWPDSVGTAGSTKPRYIVRCPV